MTDGRRAPRFSDLGILAGYTTSENNLLHDFYTPVLSSAVRYDRAVGYFTSGLMAISAVAYADFVANGGKIRLICSPHVTEADSKRIDASSSRDRLSKNDLVESMRELARANDLAAALTTAMSSLLAADVMEIKFATPTLGDGLFHDKLGIFTDSAGDRISFVGSANETAAAWSGVTNHEQIETFCAWDDPEQTSRVNRHEQKFNELWNNVVRGVEVKTARASAALVYEASPASSVEASLEHLRATLERQRQSTSNTPSVRALRDHQKLVLENWNQRDQRGLVAFATGGGKTLVGIEAARRWLATDKPVLILVPSSLLHKQWQQELRAELPSATVITAGADATKSTWLTNLNAATSADSSLGPRIVLATYQTAVTGDFMNRINQGDHLLLIADEVHRMGAPDTRRLFELDVGGRLGLSATPDRYGDELGTTAIYRYFGDVLEPRFGIRDAIAAKQLVPYDYYLESVELNDDELDRWDALSKSLATEIARNDGALSDRALHLARTRARILKSASGKAPLAAAIVQANYTEGDRWLIYCDDLAHLAEVRLQVESSGRTVFEYHSKNVGVGPEILRQFASGGILLAVKCLDEGIDLPYINKALILASTTNPREYIQRRGRVLRRFPGKRHAEVFDVAVLDRTGCLLSAKEAERAEEFARDASNKSGLVRLNSLIASSVSTDSWRRDSVSTESTEDGDEQ